MKTRTILFLCALVALPSFCQVAQTRCRLKGQVGDVEVRRDKQAQWAPATPKQSLSEGDAVQTSAASIADIEMEDGSLLRLNENTLLELVSLRRKETVFNVSIIKISVGNLYAEIRKLTGDRSSFEIVTPTSTCAVRGTKLEVDVSGGRSDFRVYEGAVFVVPLAGGGGVEVRENQMTSVSQGQAKLKVVPLAEKPATGPPAAGASAPDLPAAAAPEPELKEKALTMGTRRTSLFPLLDADALVLYGDTIADETERAAVDVVFLYSKTKTSAALRFVSPSVAGAPYGAWANRAVTEFKKVSVDFDAISLPSEVAGLWGPGAGETGISLAAGDVVVIKTNAGGYRLVEIESITGTGDTATISIKGKY